MRWTCCCWFWAGWLLPATMALGGDGDWPTHLDGPCDPYAVGRETPKLVTPRWVGEPGVEAVVVLSTDDLRQPAKHEQFLRPILARLEQIDGRAPVSLMANRIDPGHPQLQAWLRQGASLEAHTFDHPCPLLQGGDLAVAKRTFDRSVDLMTTVAGNRPVAFRMPCCDSMSSVSPRFFTEIFGKTTPSGNFLAVDSSVFLLYTAADGELPRELVLDAGGQQRFRKYVPTDRIMANLIEDYPYPYVIDRLCWEIPALMPSDWDAQHRNGVCSPATVADLKAAVDATVVKQGVFALCFHPHGWIRNDQIVEMIDHAVAVHGRKVKFLTFREVYDRLTKHFLGGRPLRAADGRDNGVRVFDQDGDGHMDAVFDAGKAQPARGRLVDLDGDGVREWIVAETGEVRQRLPDGSPEAFIRLPFHLPPGTSLVDQQGRDAGLRFVDVDEDGRLDVVFSNARGYCVHLLTSMEAGWSRGVLSGKRGQQHADAELPPIVRADGTNNGAWFQNRQMWLQNEDTGRKLPDHVFHRRFSEMLGGSR
ncbi:MAG: polysaccharide deacetylase family protein [Pirellulales bacterium]|nr:polysaccharide deacetylase family protein [Pirellulales bacterium]